MENIIELKKITKEYEQKGKKIIAIKETNLQFEKNKLYAIMGHSGSGKSTLINILGLITKPTSGDYYLDSKNIKNMSDNELAEIRLKKIGFIFQQFYLEENLTALENVCLPMLANKNIKKNERKIWAEKILTYLGLKDRLNHKPKELSGGEQQRVAIARALANDPKIILADEPTGNLDEKSEKIIFNLLKKISDSGRCVIIVSHSKEVTKYADKIFQIKNGEVLNTNNE